MAALKPILLAWLAFAIALDGADESLVGTWKLLSAQTIKTNGARVNLFGQHPSGFLTYTAEGRMFAIITTEGRKRYQVADRFQMAVPEQAEAFSTVLAYAGTYAVENGRIIHHVEASSFENWVNTDQIRLLKLKSRRLTLTSLNSIGGDQARTDLVWGRVR
jgi:Lipocalin-like domain